MDLKLNDIQLQLNDALSRLLAKEYTFEARQGLLQNSPGPRARVWGQLAEMGVLGAAIGEEYGGFGGDAVDLSMISEALGKVLALEPYHSTVVMASTALQAMGSPKQKSEWLPRIAMGMSRMGWAHQERQHGRIECAAMHDSAGWFLTGSKEMVLDAPSCQQFIVSATTPDDGIQLFLVNAADIGLHLSPYRLVDGSPAGNIQLENVQGKRLGGTQDTAAALEHVMRTGITCACAEMLGAMEGASAMTFEYLKIRRQFGRPIGSNQALQHRAADMLVAREQSRSLVMSLALTLAGRNDFARGDGQFHAAKVLIGRNARRIAEEAIQMHGGIGMTHECAVGHYLKRILVLDQLHGETQYHLGVLEEPHRREAA